MTEYANKLLALDPSSSAIGYAVMRGPDTMIEAGVMRPDKATAKFAMRRISDLVDQVHDVIGRHFPWTIVVEMPGRQASKGKGKSAGASLMIYAWACGAVWQVCRTYALHANEEAYTSPSFSSTPPCTVVEAYSNVWSTERKEKRQLLVIDRFPRYGCDEDPGMDCSDAINLGWWWYDQQRTAAMIDEAGR